MSLGPYPRFSIKMALYRFIYMAFLLYMIRHTNYLPVASRCRWPRIC